MYIYNKKDIEMTTYVITHRDFALPSWLEGDVKIVTDKDLKNDYKCPVIKADNELAPLKHSYSELFQMYDIYRKDTTSDFICIQHYRRYFRPVEAKNTLPIPFNGNILTQYAMCHNIEHLNQCIALVNKYYPTYNTDNLDKLIPCNMSIQDHDTFNDYCNFLFTILQAFHEQNHLYTDADVANYVSTYNNQPISYQSRLGGFLSERLGTIYFLNHQENNYTYKPIVPYE